MKTFSMGNDTVRCSAIVLTCLVVFLSSSYVQSTKTLSSINFRKASIDLKEALIFESPARSRLHCARLCVADLYCARFLFSTDTALCQGHCSTLTNGHNGTYRALVWERGGATTPFTNVASGKPAVQSSLVNNNRNNGAHNALDGTHGQPCSRTSRYSSPPHWWMVDLQDTFSVATVTVDNFIGGKMLTDFAIHIYTEDPRTSPQTTGSLCYQQQGRADPLAVLPCSPTTAPGRFLRISSTQSLRLCEVMVAAYPVYP